MNCWLNHTSCESSSTEIVMERLRVLPPALLSSAFKASDMSKEPLLCDFKGNPLTSQRGHVTQDWPWMERRPFTHYDRDRLTNPELSCGTQLVSVSQDSTYSSIWMISTSGKTVTKDKLLQQVKHRKPLDRIQTLVYEHMLQQDAGGVCLNSH